MDRPHLPCPIFAAGCPLHWGQGPGLSDYDLGEQTGNESVTLLSTQMPGHSHGISANLAADTGSPLNAFPSNDGRTPSNIYASTTDGTQMNAAMVGQSGGNQPHANLQPLLCVTFIIALEGIYPSRN